jgi:hypothetical protein
MQLKNGPYVANTKKLEAAHHRWQRRILGIIWKDKVTNEEVRRKTGLEKLEVILKRRRLQWWGHLQNVNQQNPKASPALGTSRLKKEKRKTEEKLGVNNH